MQMPSLIRVFAGCFVLFFFFLGGGGGGGGRFFSFFKGTDLLFAAPRLHCIFTKACDITPVQNLV